MSPDAPPPPANRGRDWSAGGLDGDQGSPDGLTRCEHLVAELAAGRWPGGEMPRLALEQTVALVAVRHPDERQAIAAVVPPSSIRDHEASMVFEGALAVDPTADAYEAVAKRLHAEGIDRTPVDLLVAGGDVVFLAGGVWRLAVAELGRRVEADRVRDAAVAAVASLDSGADPVHVAGRLAGRLAS